METLLVTTETRRNQSEDPSSERWVAYYKDARRRRRARGPSESTRAKLRRFRNRQRAGMIAGFLVVGVLASIFYFVLG